MDQLLKSTSELQVIDLDGGGNDTANILRALRGCQIQRPTVQGHHPPSTAALDSLNVLYFSDLRQGHRHAGRVLHVTVIGIEEHFGSIITGKDDASKSGKIWSLLGRPFGRELVEGIRLAIKEPYFGTAPSGDSTVCVHHPSDIVLLQNKDAETRSDQLPNGKMTTEPSCRAEHVEVRPSNLGGRGMFATQDMGMGDAILFEQPLGISNSADTSIYEPGMQDLLPGATTSSRKLSLLQDLVDKLSGSPSLHSRFFSLHAGNFDSQSSGGVCFNTYAALSVIKHNCHTIFPGNASAHHDPSNSPKSSPKLTPNDQRPGIWLQASMFNHCCLPNASWSWVGDMFVIRANREIAAGEEVTTAYVPSSYDYETRQKTLKAGNDFDCSCELCTVEGSINRTAESKEALSKAQKLQAYSRGDFLGKRPTVSPEELVRRAITCYSPPTYDDLPYIQLAEPFYQLAHILLGPVQKWRIATDEVKGKAKECFLACVQVALGYRLAIDPETSYCALLPSRHAQPKPIGVLALMGLAELAYLEDCNSTYSRSLKVCAKKLYGIWYGEDATLKKQHGYFLCSKEDKLLEKESPLLAPTGGDWEALKEKKMAGRSEIPTFLAS